MNPVFQLIAQVFGKQRRVAAHSDGYSYTVTTEGGQVAARSLTEAIRVARDDIGSYLVSASRPGVPWGLYVSVGHVQAVYGEWPLLPGGGAGSGVAEEAVTRIRRRYKDGGPRAALENAIQIIDAYTEKRRAA